MPSEFLVKYKTLVDLTPQITMASIATVSGRQSSNIDNSTIRGTRGRVYWKTKSGGTAPAAGGLYKLYMASRSNGSPDISDDGIGTTDTGVSTEPVFAELLGQIILANTANLVYQRSFKLWNPPEYFNLIVWNGSNQTWSTTSGDHELQWHPYADEAQ